MKGTILRQTRIESKLRTAHISPNSASIHSDLATSTFLSTELRSPKLFSLHHLRLGFSSTHLRVIIPSYPDWPQASARIYDDPSAGPIHPGEQEQHGSTDYAEANKRRQPCVGPATATRRVFASRVRRSSNSVSSTSDKLFRCRSISSVFAARPCGYEPPNYLPKPDWQ